MCGRTALNLAPDYIIERLEIPEWIDRDKYQPSFNVSPSYYQPVITRGLGNNPSQKDKDAYQQPGNPKLIRSMKWGLIPSWAANNPKTGAKIQPVNIRDDSLTENVKPMFRNIRNSQRCLVVSQGFYEWKRDGKNKVPYFSTPSDQEDKDIPFVLLGALYDRVQIAGHEIYSYAIVTTPSNDQFKIHDRMPLMFDPELDQDEIEDWLNPKLPMNDRIKEIITPFERKLTTYQVPDSVNKAGSSHPSMMLPLNKKSTLLGLFQKPKPPSNASTKVKEDPLKKEDTEIPSTRKISQVIEIKEESSDDDIAVVQLGKRSTSQNSDVPKSKIKKEH